MSSCVIDALALAESVVLVSHERVALKEMLGFASLVRPTLYGGVHID